MFGHSLERDNYDNCNNNGCNNSCIICCRGPAGPQGRPGMNGAQGATGSTGPAGEPAPPLIPNPVLFAEFFNLFERGVTNFPGGEPISFPFLRHNDGIIRDTAVGTRFELISPLYNYRIEYYLPCAVSFHEITITLTPRGGSPRNLSIVAVDKFGNTSNMLVAFAMAYQEDIQDGATITIQHPDIIALGDLQQATRAELLFTAFPVGQPIPF